jgi:hypothetical protein
MTEPRRFPPPWIIEEYRGISYIIRYANNFARGLCVLRVGGWTHALSHDSR